MYPNLSLPLRREKPGFSAFSRSFIAAAAIASALAVIAPAASAWACGGCFSPPGRTQILQDAERILFYREPATNTTKVWIEIKYNGPAKEFGWVLPLPKQPVKGGVGVGTSYVFDRLDQAAAPRFVTKRGSTMENCHETFEDGGGCGGVGFASEDRATGGAALNSAPGEAGQGGSAVKVLEQAQAGPYDYKILASSDSAALLQWLNDNKFDTPKTALPVIDAHLKKGDVFIAVKLVNGAGVKEIRPITLEMDGADACVPLRLTAIAAVEDMNVVVYLLGPGRAVPKNLMHVTVNPLRLRWDGGVTNYPEVLSAAIDEAAGRAFVTEYAGPSKTLQVPQPVSAFNVDATGMFNQPIANPNAFPPQNVTNSPWSAGDLFNTKLLDATPLQHVKTVSDLVKVLKASPMILVQDSAAAIEKEAGLAAKMGKSDAVLQFYVDLRNNAEGSGLTDTLLAGAVDGGKLFKEIKEGVIDPVYDVADMLNASTKMTRLALRIDPQEMDRDPLFAFNKELPDVASLHTAELHSVCPGGDFKVTAARLKIEGGGSYIVTGERRFQNDSGTPRQTLLSQSTALDPRWKDAPAALSVEVLEETGKPIPVPLKKIDEVDGLIAGSVPGKPTLPAGTELGTAGARWTPPDNDAQAGLKFTAERTQPNADGCSMERGARRPLSLGLLLLVSLAVLWVARRRVGLT